jgi:rhodanese-related sulfurtransferase
MESLNAILGRAKQRATENGLGYTGALTPTEAWEVLKKAPTAKLVDVRSQAELDLVGRIPDTTHIQWAFYPEWKPNPDFIAQLKQQVDPEGVVIFMCRSGARSDKAAKAAAAAGFAEVYNMLEGFEGEANAQTRHRGEINGWRAAHLPWFNA